MNFFLQHNIIKLREPLYFLTIILLVSLVSRDFYFRLDLSEDKRHSLCDSSITFLNKVNDQVSIKVYLDGDLTVDYKRFRDSIKGILNIIEANCTLIKYQFVNINSLSILITDH